MFARRSSSALAALLASLTLAAPVYAEPDAYMRIKAGKSDIKGGVTLKGREDMIEVVAVEHSVDLPTDAATGRATGKRQHRPFTITKPVDKSSPLLHGALTNNEALTEVTIQFYAASAKTGAETNYYTVTLKNARIISIRHVMEDNRHPDKARLSAYEQVSFTYEGITWTWNDPNISTSDNLGTSK